VDPIEDERTDRARLRVAQDRLEVDVRAVIEEEPRRLFRDVDGRARREERVLGLSPRDLDANDMPGSMRCGSVRSSATVTKNERRNDFGDGSRATGLISVIVPGTRSRDTRRGTRWCASRSRSCRRRRR